MAHRTKKLVVKVLAALPRWRLLYRACRSYCQVYDGEGIGDPSINGEALFLDRHLRPGGVVFDAGAHDGSWSAAVLARDPTARIHAFEASAEAFARLAARRWPAPVTCRHLALSSSVGRGRLYSEIGSLYPKPRRQPGGALLVPRRLEEVATTTVDRYCREHGVGAIHLLKLDVEGHELEVLRGARGMLAAGRIDLVQFEYGPYAIYARAFLRDAFELFAGHGYRLFKITPRGLRPLPAYDELEENFRYKNLVAMR